MWLARQKFRRLEFGLVPDGVNALEQGRNLDPQRPRETDVLGDPRVDLAAELIKACEKNELAADKRFQGKDLEITGEVAKIDTDVWNEDKYILELGGGDDFEIILVRCHDMPSDELEKLSVGDKTTVVGAFDDGGDLGVDVRQCRLA